MVNVPAFRHIVDLARANRTNHCDLQVLRKSLRHRTDRSSAQPSPSSSTSSPQFKRPKTVAKNRRRLIPNGVSTNVEECTSGTEIADGAGFSDDDDAEYLVTSAKEIQQNLSDDEETTSGPDRENYKIVLNLLEGLEHKGHCVTMDNYYNSPALARYLKCRGFDCLGTERLTRKNIPEDVKEMKKN
ncbi:PiggyBac transposable element-derived protein 4 [Eumeta japonica]|uniref:PiggyBac transposable element-derived protein 4 n=1 Tax=Eumeta variegata TaxID=151549 RepID=A0A4C1Z2S7_EUMVA|nr:PiggyBac transposable element-derived protein 4 [Eumeta japonica]